MKYNLNELEVFNIAINTETSADLAMTSAWLKSQGKPCFLEPHDWDVSEENTCIVVSQNPKLPIIISSKDVFKRQGFDILKASEQFSIDSGRPGCKAMEDGDNLIYTIT